MSVTLVVFIQWYVSCIHPMVEKQSNRGAGRTVRTTTIFQRVAKTQTTGLAKTSERQMKLLRKPRVLALKARAREYRLYVTNADWLT